MGISISELLVLLVIAVVLFGTKHLRNLGSDLGGAINGFRNAIKKTEAEKPEQDETKAIDGEVISPDSEKANSNASR